MVQARTKPSRSLPQRSPQVSSSTSVAEYTLAFDTETTGLDFRHGTKPYFITTCSSNDPEVPEFWRWRVDPITRVPIIPSNDLDEVRSKILVASRIVMQNGKFDVTAMSTIDPDLAKNWPWDRTDDLLLKAHLLASNRPKDLTTLGIMYLDIDITPYEERIHQATEQARRYCRSRLKDWRIAKKGLEDMPGAKGECWKADMWLPMAVIEEIGQDALNEHYEEDLSWWQKALEEYANADSVLTLALRNVMLDRIKERKLDKIYEMRRKLPHLTYKMESRGVTLSLNKLEAQHTEYTESSHRAEAICVNIAKERGYDLKMPKGASVNDSMRGFVFDILQLEKVFNPKARKGKGEDYEPSPTLDSKNAIPYYLDTLPKKSDAYVFIKTLAAKRSRDTACTFMEMYKKFWVEVPGKPGWYKLHPNFKPTATDTLRWGCDNPAVQNISKKENFNLRACFGPMPGREWWSLDAKNIELRLPFYESGETALIDLFEHPDDPPFYGSNHLLNFSVIYPDIWAAAVKLVGLEKAGPYCKKEYKDSYYQWCKNGNFAIQYGAVDKVGGGGTADRAFHKNGAHAMLKERFGKLEILNTRQIQFANKYGYVETIPDRSVDPERGYPLLCTRTEYGKILETVPLSYRVQGSAMWWTGRAQMRCQDQLDQWQTPSWDGFICMQVHDEIVFDFPASKVDPRIHMEEYEKKGKPIPLHKRSESNLWKIRVLQDKMAQGGRDFVLPSCPNGIPTPTGICYHTDNWSEEVTLA